MLKPVLAGSDNVGNECRCFWILGFILGLQALSFGLRGRLFRSQTPQEGKASAFWVDAFGGWEVRSDHFQGKLTKWGTVGWAPHFHFMLVGFGFFPQ